MSIECERCGNCCPTTCKSLVILKEEPRLTSCKIHGNEKPFYCNISPFKLYCSGIACRAILGVINETDTIIKIESNGQRTFSKI